MKLVKTRLQKLMIAYFITVLFVGFYLALALIIKK